MKARPGLLFQLDWTGLSGMLRNGHAHRQRKRVHEIYTCATWRVMYLQALDGQNRGVHVPGISQLRRTADAHGRRGRHGHDCGC